ncbi:hypothetical protein PG987_008801 [Apiospora arundinis]
MLFAQSRSSLITLAVAAGLLLGQTAAYKFTFYQGPGCRSGGAGNNVAGPGQGCMPKTGNAQSAIIQSTGAVDDNFAVTFYSSDNCDPASEVWHSTEIMSGEGDDVRNSICFQGQDKGRTSDGSRMRSGT